MSNFNFTTLMSPDQIDLAREASAIAHDHVKGAKLYEALKVGDAILIGRKTAMDASGSNRPNGRQYALALTSWKSQFGFDGVPPAYLDDCMIAAQHRTISDEIIAGLASNQRANLGISGLAKRVRTRLREITVAPTVNPNAPKKPRSEKELALALAEAEAKIKALETRIHSDGSLFDIEKTAAETIARIIVEETAKVGQFNKAQRIRAALEKEINARKKRMNAQAG